MSSFDKTMRFNFPEEPYEHDVKEVLYQVYDALQEKGYNPICLYSPPHGCTQYHP